jgi:hypothetical protein
MRKAQAAIDFIMTYSWAVLAMVAVLGVLAFFGLLSPEKYIADECVFLQEGFKCMSHKIEQNSISLSIQNLKGAEVEITSLSFDECVSEQKTILSPNGVADMAFSGCATGGRDRKFKKTVEISYKDPGTGFSKAALLALDSRIE